jgi:hypothetical protein
MAKMLLKLAAGISTALGLFRVYLILAQVLAVLPDLGADRPASPTAVGSQVDD